MRSIFSNIYNIVSLFQFTVFVLISFLFHFMNFNFTIAQQVYSSNYFNKEAMYSKIELNDELREISGLAVSDDDRVFCHNDEHGIIFQIDPENGKIIKRFYLGEKIIKEDFEGIAIAGHKFFMVSSSGDIYEFEEGNDGERVEYKIHNTGLSSKSNVEGLCYDIVTNSLLLACKEKPGKKYKDFRAVYSFSLRTNKLNDEPYLLINLKELQTKFGIKDFYPSGIEISNDKNSFFLISSKGKPAVIEIDRKSNILFAKNLNKKKHNQPEGISFLKDYSLLISDEGGKGKSVLSRYKK
ncbi:MAG: SdiA-regulated domain-containing protein [Bacteroidetes bacterium]|nr:SdiA-regulated domain-containing protein [Bacteroidota bacterium]